MTDIKATAPTLTTHPTVDSRVGSATIELAADGGSYRAVRLFGAPPERVFRAFTEPDDLRQWFPAAAPPGSRMTTCESDPRQGGAYLFVLEMPEYGRMAWHGTYTQVDPPSGLQAKEWFVMGDEDPDGEPCRQTLSFDPAEGGGTLMTMDVVMPAPEDPEAFMEQSAAGLTMSLDVIDQLIST